MGTPHKILVVEDESVVSMDLEASLTRLGYRVTGSATSGQEALIEIEKNRPDLVLMDIQLHGDMDGLATAELIHRQFEIPVVFVTANANDEVIARSKQSASYGFLNKPFRSGELNATIEIALHQHGSGQKLAVERERLEKRVNQTFEELVHTREELQALSRHLMKAQEEERARIARELHDDLGQQVALVRIQVDLLERDLPLGMKERSEALRAGLDNVAQGLRGVSHALHPSIISDLGLKDALESLMAGFRSQGLVIRGSLAQVGNLPHDVSTSLYRIAQECLNNVLKHAPSSRVFVNLTASVTELHLQISDDGKGFAIHEARRRGGLGLISMQERARLIGGNLLLNSDIDKGTTIVVNVPLQP